MNTYAVTVTVNGADAGTYTVKAEREGIARTLAVREMQNERSAGRISTPPSAEAHGIDFISYSVIPA